MIANWAKSCSAERVGLGYLIHRSPAPALKLAYLAGIGLRGLQILGSAFTTDIMARLRLILSLWELLALERADQSALLPLFAIPSSCLVITNPHTEILIELLYNNLSAV